MCIETHMANKHGMERSKGCDASQQTSERVSVAKQPNEMGAETTCKDFAVCDPTYSPVCQPASLPVSSLLTCHSWHSVSCNDMIIVGRPT